MTAKFTGLALVVGCAMTGAAAEAQTGLDLANEYPAVSVHGMTADRFAELVEEKTGGEVSITTHHGAALGYKSLDQFDAVGDGALDLASSSLVFWTGIDPMFQLPSLPFVAPTVEDTHDLYEAALPTYERIMEENNQVLLVMTPWPASGLWGNEPLDTLEAIQGRKVRTYDVSSTETMRNAGAFPVQISWSDVPAQLSTGAIDSVLTSADGGVGVQMWEQQKFFTVVNYAMPLQAIHMNRDAFEMLSEQQQQQIRAAATEAQEYGWDLLGDRTRENFATMREHGMTVIEDVSPEYLAALSSAAKPFVDSWIEASGEEGAAILARYEELRQQ